MGAEESKTLPVLNERDKRDIAKDLEAMLSKLDDGDDLMFDGDPMSDEARASEVTDTFHGNIVLTNRQLVSLSKTVLTLNWGRLKTAF